MTIRRIEAEFRRGVVNSKGAVFENEELGKPSSDLDWFVISVGTEMYRRLGEPEALYVSIERDIVPDLSQVADAVLTEEPDPAELQRVWSEHGPGTLLIPEQAERLEGRDQHEMREPSAGDRIRAITDEMADGLEAKPVAVLHTEPDPESEREALISRWALFLDDRSQHQADARREVRNMLAAFANPSRAESMFRATYGLSDLRARGAESALRRSSEFVGDGNAHAVRLQMLGRCVGNDAAGTASRLISAGALGSSS